MSAHLELTPREIKEIQLCQYYADKLHHGTRGHNQMMLIAKLTGYMGFALAGEGAEQMLVSPRNVKVVEEKLH